MLADGNPGDGLPCGGVALSDRHCLAVRTGQGLLSIKELQMEGKKRMDIETFLRGYPIPAGDVFVNRTQQ